MDKLKSRLKFFWFLLIIWSFCYLIAEVVSFLLLVFFLKPNVTIDYNNCEQLTRKFPAQLRLPASEIRGLFPRALPLMRAGNYMSFDYEPALGFRADDAHEWYGAGPDDLVDKFIIVTFGGSTTVRDNWPKYLLDAAEDQGVEQNIAVLNAGHWGYMSFNEKLYFSSWVLPLVARAGRVPDLVLSLDGVNDVWARIMGYLEAETQQSEIWYSQYHGYHQQLSTDMKQLGTFSGSARQLTSSLARGAYDGVITYLAPIAPYTLKATLEVLRRLLQSAPPQEEIVAVAEENIVILEDKVQDKIVSGFRSCLLDFFGAARARNVQFVAYLQPVYLAPYYPYGAPGSFYYPDFNYFAINFFRENKHWSRLDRNILIKTETVYEKAEEMYRQLNQQHPGHFSSLAHIFNAHADVENIYNKDAIHYARKGKEIIAERIVADLISKGILSAHSEQQGRQ